MRKRILFISLLITFLSLIFYSIISTDIYYNNSINNAKEYLKVYMNQYDDSISLTHNGAKELSEKLDGARVTFMELDGDVIADSTAENTLENHSDREEVINAIINGSGYAVRDSSTIGENLIYYCEKHGEILVRISIPTNSQWHIFSASLPTIIWFLVLDTTLCFLFTLLATNFIIKPVVELSKEASKLDKENLKSKYQELEPIVKVMNNMKDNINKKIIQIEEDHNRENMLLDNIDHGIIIIKNNKVQLINKSALNTIPYNELTRELELDEKIKNELIENNFAYYEINKKTYAIRLTQTSNQNVILITDVTDIKKAEKTKNEFISNVTHEMNTPLTSIKGFAELLKFNDLEKEKKDKALQTIIDQSDKLQKLIKDIINYSSIMNEELETYSLNLSKMTKELLINFQTYCKNYKVTIKTDIDDDVYINSRYEIMTELLNNLISNAIKYNKENGYVMIRIKPNLIEITDSGIGISEDNIPRIFDRFYTVDKSHSGINGFGLGLSIVKKIVKNSNFKLNVISKLGEGTSFIINF